MASARKIRPDDKISDDHKSWMAASRVLGLWKIHNTDAEAPQHDPVHVDNLAEPADGDLTLRPPEVVRRENSTLSALQSSGPPLPVGSTHCVVVPQRQVPGLIAGLIGVVLFFASMPFGVWADHAWGGGEDHRLYMFLFMLAALVSSGILVTIALVASSSSIVVEVCHGGCATVRVVRRIFFLVRSHQHVRASAGDRLEKRVKYEGVVREPSMEHRAVRSLRNFLHGSGDEDYHTVYRFQLVLVAKNAPAPLVLFEEGVEDYFATRHGTPPAAEEIVKLLRRAVPALRVRDVEE